MSNSRKQEMGGCGTTRFVSDLVEALEPDAPDAADYDYPYDDDDGLDEDGNFPFKCAAYWTGADWHCPMAGTEDCDWECPGHPGEP